MNATLLAAAHGTRSAAGLATMARLIDLVRDARPDLAVDLCYLDVAEPSLRHRVDALHGAAVIVPVLLSTGYHVLDDIPAVVAARRGITVARHLGPHPLLDAALADRLQDAGGAGADSIALVGSPSRKPGAASELATAAAGLATLLDRPVEPANLDASLPTLLSGLAGRVAVATYLLAEGYFFDTLRQTASSAGVSAVSRPLGAHPAVAQLILERYDEARAPDLA